MKTLNQIEKEYKITRYTIKKLMKENYLVEDYDYDRIDQISKPIIKFNENGEEKIKDYINS